MSICRNPRGIFEEISGGISEEFPGEISGESSRETFFGIPSKVVWGIIWKIHGESIRRAICGHICENNSVGIPEETLWKLMKKCFC